MGNNNVFVGPINVFTAMQLENMVFNIARNGAIPGYQGGAWRFEKKTYKYNDEVEIEALYMRYPFEGILCCEFSYNEAMLTSDAAGIAITLIALSHLSFRLYEKESPDTDKVVELFHNLRGYAIQHAEASSILAFID